MLTGCSDSKQETEINEKLNNNIDSLISNKTSELRIKQGEGQFYNTSKEFRERIQEKLSNYKNVESNEEFNSDYDLILKFDDYEQLFFNTENGFFWFEDSEIFYEAEKWNKELWNRHILKEIDGEIIYHSFGRDIIEQMSYIDLDQDNSFDDKIILYYDGDIRLQVKEIDVGILADIEPDIVESKIPSNMIESHLYIQENERNNSYMITAGSTYSFVNRIGSLSWIRSYLYKDNKLVELWNSEDVVLSKIIVKDLKEDVLTLYIENLNTDIGIKLTPDEKSNLKEYLESLEEINEEFIGMEQYEFFSGITQYAFYDYNKDGKEELMINLYMRGGASGITRRIVSIYDVSGEEVKFLDVVVNGDDEEIMKAFD